jgi:hypothetical protein
MQGNSQAFFEPTADSKQQTAIQDVAKRASDPVVMTGRSALNSQLAVEREAADGLNPVTSDG